MQVRWKTPVRRMTAKHGVTTLFLTNAAFDEVVGDKSGETAHRLLEVRQFRPDLVGIVGCRGVFANDDVHDCPPVTRSLAPAASLAVHGAMPDIPVGESISESTSSIAVGSMAATPWNGI